jgi:hypothetical protein
VAAAVAAGIANWLWLREPGLAALAAPIGPRPSPARGPGRTAAADGHRIFEMTHGPMRRGLATPGGRRRALRTALRDASGRGGVHQALAAPGRAGYPWPQPDLVVQRMGEAAVAGLARRDRVGAAQAPAVVRQLPPEQAERQQHRGGEPDPDAGDHGRGHRAAWPGGAAAPRPPHRGQGQPERGRSGQQGVGDDENGPLRFDVEPEQPGQAEQRHDQRGQCPVPERGLRRGSAAAFPPAPAGGFFPPGP